MRIATLVPCSLLGLLVQAPSATAQEIDPTKVDAVFAEWDKPDSPGCALGVVQEDRLVYSRGYGMADLERGVPISPDGVFYLASVSKQFTAASIALLAQQGRVSLDDDIRKFLPELPQYDAPITIRHLIHHTSGLRDYLTLMTMADMSLEDAHAPPEILELIARQEALNFPPGTQYLYSNTGYFLIPVIIQRVTGQSIREFAQEHIFGPLGMRDTHFHDDYTMPVPNRVFSYRTSEEKGFELNFLEKFDQVGSGGVLSTVNDLARWDRNLYTGTVGGSTLIDLLHTRGILNDGDTLSYAFGLGIGESKGLRTVSHGGSMMGFRTHVLRFPKHRFSVITLCNLRGINPGRLARQVADVYLEEAFAGRLTEYLGAYDSRELEVTWTIGLEEGNLVFVREDEPALSLASQEHDRFRLQTGAEVRFDRDEENRIAGFVLDAGRAKGVVFRKKKGVRD